MSDTRKVLERLRKALATSKSCVDALFMIDAELARLPPTGNLWRTEPPNE